MCGLYGFITKGSRKLTRSQKTKRATIIKALAIAMQVRGTHSTGVTAMNNKQCVIFKKAYSADQFVKEPQFKSVVYGPYNILLGHTRLASQGSEVNDENAHPFRYGNIIGCHNGRVANYRLFGEDFTVDSQAIFALLQRFNNNYQKAFGELVGRFAITWADINEPSRLFFIVNGNPLWIVRIPEIDTIIYASDEFPLKSVVSTQFDISTKIFWTPKINYAYQVDSGLVIKKKFAPFKDVSSNFPASSFCTPIEPVTTSEPENQIPLLPASKTEVPRIFELPLVDKRIITAQIQTNGCSFCQAALFYSTQGLFYYSQVEKTCLCAPCYFKIALEKDQFFKVALKDYFILLEELDEQEKARTIIG